jgi:hypothetical protein
MKAKIGNREFRLVLSPMKTNRLPKRSNGTVPVVVNGTPFVAPVTNNASWSASPDVVLEYIWIEYEGKAYYLTLDYAEKASSLAGEEIVVSEGAAARPDPERVTALGEKEKARVEAFRATWARKYG